MGNHPIFADDMREIVESFVVESQEIFDGLDNDLLQLEQTPDDLALIDQIFRAVHTIKGTSGFLSLEQLSVLSHHFEDVLNRLRRGEIEVQPEMMDTMLAAFDQMKVLMQQVVDQQLETLDLDELIAELSALANGEAQSAGPAAPSETGRVSGEESSVSGDDPMKIEDEPPAPESDLKSHPIFADDMREIVESFIVESQEIFDALDNDLLQLEQTPGDQALVDQIFRAVHTIKGTSGFLSLEQLSVLSHHFEDVLNRMRRGELQPRPGMMDIMLVAFDQMKVLMQQVVEQRLQPLDLDDLLSDLAALSAGEEVEVREEYRAQNDPAQDEEPVATEGDAQDAQPNPASKSPRRPMDRKSETIRVEVDRLDALLNLVGELVLGRNRLLQLVTDMSLEHESDDLVRELTDTSTQVDFITTELQSAIMHTRMIQIGRVFNKFPRVVRDLAREFDKEINLVIEGEETELDKSLVEEIGDPLVHLIRNAADHGIEQPDVRAERGKPAAGRLRLAAAHEGNHIVITIEDDGAGMDPDRLREKAVERGMMTEAEAKELSDNEVFNLIFHPGFSMAKQVSKVSGRGVGMDVVKTNITRLNGTIGIHSRLGEGTRFTLKLPLTLAIIQSLLVRAGDESYAVPLHAVIEVVGLHSGNMSSIKGRPVLRLREQVLPLMDVHDTLGRHGDAHEGPRYAVVVGIAHHRLGLVVDELIGQKEIVIKPLGTYLKKVPGLAGSTILGDGRVIMILDVGELVRISQEKRKMAEAANAA